MALCFEENREVTVSFREIWLETDRITKQGQGFFSFVLTCTERTQAVVWIRKVRLEANGFVWIRNVRLEANGFQILRGSAVDVTSLDERISQIVVGFNK